MPETREHCWPAVLRLAETYHGNACYLAIDGPYAGWVCYEHPDGQLVTLRQTPMFREQAAQIRDLQQQLAELHAAGPPSPPVPPPGRRRTQS